MKRVMRETSDPRPIMGPDDPREHVVLISDNQIVAMKQGAALPVRIDCVDCLVIARHLAPPEIAARIMPPKDRTTAMTRAS